MNSFRRLLAPLPVSSVRFTDSFWGPRQDLLIEATLPGQYEQLVKTYRLRNFEMAARAVEQGNAEGLVHEGYYYNDSDVYKWLEAVGYAAMARPDHPKLSALLDSAVGVADLICAAQMADGYLNTVFTVRHPGRRWTYLAAMHEMYCAGHFIEAAIAFHEATGHSGILEAAVRLGDHLDATFGSGKRIGCCGHQELELALVALSDYVRDTKYRELARWMLEIRGQRPSIFETELRDPDIYGLNPGYIHLNIRDGVYSGEYCQDHLPIREHSRVVGHAVRAMYMYIAATSVAAEMDKEAPGVSDAIVRCWANLTERRMYVTGGIGPSGRNEGFTEDFDLPNLTAYAETCAAVGLSMWGRQLLEHTGDGAFADVYERAMFNGALSGISLDGTAYFYDNPLESRGSHGRVPWFSCACCPPNIARFLGQIGRYVLGQSEDSIWIHVLAGLEAEFRIGGVGVRLRCETDYPFGGKARLFVECDSPVEFGLRIRIPDWCGDASFDVPGHDEAAEFDDGYALIRRVWSNDEVGIELEMIPTWVESHSAVLENAGRVCLTYGPLVYAAEELGISAAPQHFVVRLAEEPVVRFEPKLLNGVNVITVSGVREVGSDRGLYAEFEGNGTEAGVCEMVPYYSWSNRGASWMQVWMRYGFAE